MKFEEGQFYRFRDTFDNDVFKIAVVNYKNDYMQLELSMELFDIGNYTKEQRYKSYFRDSKLHFSESHIKHGIFISKSEAWRLRFRISQVCHHLTHAVAEELLYG